MWHTKRRLAAAATALLMMLSVTGVSVFAEENAAEAAETEQPAVISSWNWADHTENLTVSEDGTWAINVPGASESNPLTQEALQELLPAQIIAQSDSENEEPMNVDLTWDLSTIPEGGFTSGTVQVTASVEGYTLAETAAPLSVSVTGGQAIAYAPLPSGDPQDSNLSDRIIPGVSPNGTTIDLFDYWITGQTDVDWGNEKVFQAEGYINKGINKDHALVFGKAMEKINGIGSWNQWKANNPSAPIYGIVKDNLDSNGYPVLNNLDTNSASLLEGRNGEESLSYLFDPDMPADGKESYKDVKGLLTVSEDGYYQYSSQENYAVYYPDSNSFTLYNCPGISSGGQSPFGQFFPFNQAKKYTSGEDVMGRIHYGIDADVWSTSSEINHYFGMHMSTRFIQQYGGHVDEEETIPVTYSFSGDDDVWIFIDGVLVADLGGIHNAVSVDINFATGQIVINPGTYNEVTSTIGEKLGLDSQTLDDNTYHTLDFFYLERGNTDSNMSLKYNLVTIPESDLIKVDQLGESVPGATFGLYAANDPNQAIATGTTDRDGQFVFLEKKNGQNYPITLQQLYEDYDMDKNNSSDADLILRETEVPDGYRGTEDVGLYFYKSNNDEVLLLSCDPWTTGAYAMPKVTATTGNSINVYNVASNPDGGTHSIQLVGNNVIDDNPLMFAVVFKKKDDGKTISWVPVSGDPLNGWHVKESSGWDSIIEAANENPYIFQIASSGAYQVEVSNLPGDIKQYYHFTNNEDTAEYTIAYYYTNADRLEDAKSDNTYRIVSEGEGSLDRVFAMNLYVSNISNNLYVQKTDQFGDPISGQDKTATFSLYKEENVSYDNATHEYTIQTGAKPYRTENTTDLTDPFALNAGVVFSRIENGQYYLIEDTAPSGYQKIDKAIPVLVDDTGVYALADEESGFTVRKGIGGIVHSMVQFAAADDIDTTLHDVTATLQTSSDNLFDPSETSDDWNNGGSKELSYADGSGAPLQYKATGAQGNSTFEDVTFMVSSGWSRISVIQNYADSDDTLKEELGTVDLSNLFSGSTVVQVQNTPVGSLSIHKVVVDSTGLAPKTDSFDFSIYGDSSLADKIFSYRKSDGSDGSIKFSAQGDQAVATVNLTNDQTITINDLNIGQYRVSETEKSNYKCEFSTDDNTFQQQTDTESANVEVTNVSAASVTFRNTYVPTADFSFVKTTSIGDPLSGATFALYKYAGTDTSNDLISFDEEGNPTDEEWEQVLSPVKSGADGIVSFTDLPVPAEGESYRLVELSAPEGYVTPKGQWIITYTNSQFNVGSVGNPPAFKENKTSDGGIQFSVFNYKQNELPLTGRNGNTLYFAAGTVVMMIGVGWLYLRKKRHAK